MQWRTPDVSGLSVVFAVFLALCIPQLAVSAGPHQTNATPPEAPPTWDQTRPLVETPPKWEDTFPDTPVNAERIKRLNRDRSLSPLPTPDLLSQAYQAAKPALMPTLILTLLGLAVLVMIRFGKSEFRNTSDSPAPHKSGAPNTLSGIPLVAPGPAPTKAPTAPPARIIVKCAAVAFVATCLFPPWRFKLRDGNVAIYRPAGYSFILVAPESEAGGVQIDFVRLFVEWTALAGIAGAVWLLAAKPACSREDSANHSERANRPLGDPTSGMKPPR